MYYVSWLCCESACKSWHPSRRHSSLVWLAVWRERALTTCVVLCCVTHHLCRVVLCHCVAGVLRPLCVGLIIHASSLSCSFPHVKPCCLSLNLGQLNNIIYYKLSDCLWVCVWVCDRTPPKPRLQS